MISGWLVVGKRSGLVPFVVDLRVWSVQTDAVLLVTGQWNPARRVWNFDGRTLRWIIICSSEIGTVVDLTRRIRSCSDKGVQVLRIQFSVVISRHGI